jgi:ParB family transcriptional regulator, chromosome partitioning protein
VSKRGLPASFKLRHDLHYVEQLTNKSTGSPIGSMIPIDKLAPNPAQPRTDFSNLDELVESIKEKGVLEPLLVRPSDVGGRFMIIAGERRFRASLEAGLTEVPCIELDVDEKAVAEISLIENLQRKDLTPFEEADGLAALAERFGYTHEDIARKIGKSRTSITETLSLAAMPADIRELCRHADITAKSMLLQVVRQPTEEEMVALVGRIKDTGLTREGARQARKGKESGKPNQGFLFAHTPKGQGYTVQVKFRKAEVGREEIRAALEDALSRIEELGD